jgi:hypothetical protein
LDQKRQESKKSFFCQQEIRKMRTPTLYEIANELNLKALSHPIGTLQEIRGHRPGVELFRLNSKTTQDRWACHWGGRTELQFNIGLGDEGSKRLRYGVAFSFQESREYKSSELLALLRPKIKAFNQFVRRYPEIFKDMYMWAWDNDNDEFYDDLSGPIPGRLVADNVFVFIGKFQPIHRINYETILNDFDKLLPLYQFVENHGAYAPVSIPLEAHFAFRPGCRTKKRSVVFEQTRELIERALRHNDLQKMLYRKLVRKFGKNNVGTENHGVNGTSVDLVVRRKHGFWFYEIKTANSPRECIREAVGQLLEYSFWPGAQEAVRLIIGGECPIDEKGVSYLRSLKKRFALPIYYEQIT